MEILILYNVIFFIMVTLVVIDVIHSNKDDIEILYLKLSDLEDKLKFANISVDYNFNNIGYEKILNYDDFIGYVNRKEKCILEIRKKDDEIMYQKKSYPVYVTLPLTSIEVELVNKKIEELGWK